MSGTRPADSMIVVVSDTAPDSSLGDASATVSSDPATSPTGDDVVAWAFEAAVALLRGSRANHILCCVAMVISCILSVSGFMMMTKDDGTSRALLMVSMAFLISQTFTLAKASRDKGIAMRALKDPTKQEAMKVFVPTRAYLAQIVLFFFIALGCSLYSLSVIEVDAQWYGFGVVDLIWLVVACFCLSKSVRDRHDASAWSKTEFTHVKQNQLRQILQESAGTLEYRIMVWLSFFAAVGFTLGFTWSSWMNFSIERKGFLSVGLIFHASSCFHMAKLVRDRNDEFKAMELSKQVPYQIMVIVSFLLSWLIPLVGVCMMGLSQEQLLFQLTGQLMTTNTTLNLAKVVRDKHEMLKLRGDLNTQGYVV
eukprot:gnl/MRDRNA2_/MRDRNA2_29961_c0_seq1.p1 gnl/MRDRNA2_/MRDRNA2_29961_c0~~gnl/MRDRNA2_/MRDRNA2_29961_c0_seq1.p1  ORF type:complete len:366 (+),score=54.62 gnl/MRDRNA2_/MRDRNA2_29961_c0_seq1:86-1183(+)